MTTKPTCTEAGVRTFTCQNDSSHTKTESILAKGHSYEAVVTAPTCEANGFTTYTCSVCDDSYTADETNALGHNWDEGKVTTKPTCTAKGVMTFTCLRDGSHTRTEAIPAAGHAYTSGVTAPTCTEKGYTTYTCSVCGDSYTANETPATGHAFGAWTQTKAPTIYAEGVETQYCANCTAANTRSIPKLPMPKVSIRNFTASRNVDYRSTITFSAAVENGISGGQIHWFVDGRDVGTGDSYTAQEARSSFDIQAKYIDGSNVLSQTEVEKVNVNTGFGARLKAFFRALFGRLPKVVQAYLGAEIIDRVIPD